jgi:alkanesulfonate monooxygenase SsuD/methylene tetrahydromethanopterin reductase-like flavin-dependent oxidoreductase (luciferase family)
MPYAQGDGRAMTVDQVMARAKLIESLGFDGIWLGDTVGRVTSARPDTLIWLTLCAAATERVELGTAIIQVPLRHPVELAVRLMTVQAMSKGRFVAGLGAGSTRADFEAVGVDYDSRFRVFAGALPQIRALLNDEQVGEANIHPWPDYSVAPPIIIGSWESGIWVERAARDYDGWMASGTTSFHALAEGIKRFRDAGGKRALVATIETDLTRPTKALSDDQPFNLHCSPEAAVERLARLAELGYDDALLSQRGHTEATLTSEHLATIRSLVPR